MPVLDNPRHERFAQYLLKGKSATEAYAMAGYGGDRHHAARLATNGHIQARVVELQSGAAARAEITVAAITDRLTRIADKAEAKDEPAYLSVARQAAMDTAKLHGLIKDRHEHTGAGGGPIKHDMSVYTDESLAQLATILGAASNARRSSGGDSSEGSKA